MVGMNPPTGSALSNLFASITPHSSEEEVEKNVIVPLLGILGYSHEDWQAQNVIGKVRLDFQVHPINAATPYPPYLVIEAKAPSKKIVYNTWQINGYMRKSGAILGVLTNGYQFKLLYNYNGHVVTIIEYSQEEVVKKFNLFKRLLCKETCLKVSQGFYKNQRRIHIDLANQLSKAFGNQEMLGLFKKKQNNIEIEELPVKEKKEEKSMIITVFNNKGGVGKSTLTINLGAELSKMGKRVLLIDVDAQANLTIGLGIDPLTDVENHGKKDITHLLTEPRVKLEDTIIKKRWGDIKLDIVPSHIRLSKMENVLNTTVGIDQVLEKKLRDYDYDFVLIDPPPSFGRIIGISLMASSGVLIPTQLSAYPIRALEYVLERVKEIEELKPIQVLGIAVSMYDQRSSSFNMSMTQKLVEILERSEATNIPFFPENTWIPRLNIISICQDKGYPIQQVEYDDKLAFQDKEAAQKAVECYTELAEYLIKVTHGG